MTTSPDGRDPANEAVRAALFKVVSTADLTDPEQAVAWARAALENDSLVESIGAGATRAATGRERPPDAHG